MGSGHVQPLDGIVRGAGARLDVVHRFPYVGVTHQLHDDIERDTAVPKQCAVGMAQVVKANSLDVRRFRRFPGQPQEPQTATAPIVLSEDEVGLRNLEKPLQEGPDGLVLCGFLTTTLSHGFRVMRLRLMASLKIAFRTIFSSQRVFFAAPLLQADLRVNFVAAESSRWPLGMMIIVNSFYSACHDGVCGSGASQKRTLGQSSVPVARHRPPRRRPVGSCPS